MNLAESVRNIPGVGDKLVGLLGRLGIVTVEDLLLNYPRRYEDYSVVSKIKDLSPGVVTIQATVEKITGRYARNRRLHITEATLSDDSDKVKAVWFNQAYLAKSIARGEELYFSGKYELSRNGLTIQNPTWEKVSEFHTSTARIVPIYRETKGITSRQIRNLVQQVLPLAHKLETSFPEQLNKTQISKIITNLHFPESSDELLQAKRAMAYQELFILISASQLAKREHHLLRAPTISFNEKLTKEFTSSLAFKLTDAQRSVAWQVIKDMQHEIPMNRLIEGDVGSGKTIVAALATLQAIKQKFQVALIAPTEILARQHADNLSKLFEPFRINVVLLTGGAKTASKKLTIQSISSGEAEFIIGTHALLEKDIEFNRLGLVIVDEQHRFGVKQREKLQEKPLQMPHLLSMTATPIPRSLSLTVYGELDISLIDQMPLGRKPIETKVVRQSDRTKVYKHIDEQIDLGRQVYVICPLIEESDVLGVKSVQAEHERLNTTIFKHRKIGLLHGRMKSAEKEAVMDKFAKGAFDILISTTVVEVGVDVANATIIMIEGAERFGLAQMHQLRGRVGRSDYQSYCYLVPTNDDYISKRLKAMESTSNGFRLAELDLKLRGPGAVYGTRQHGDLDLRFAQLDDTKLISQVQRDVKIFLDSDDISGYPRLMEKIMSARAVTQLN